MANILKINTRTDYIEIGSSYTKDQEIGTLKNKLVLPAPKSIPFTSEFMVDATRNTKAQMILRQVGRTQHKGTISWNALPCQQVWEINRWFEKHGYVFWIRYFCHPVGKVLVQQMYRGDMNAINPSTNQIKINGLSVPEKYFDYGFSIIDMGKKVYTEKTL